MSDIVERLREGCGCNFPETTCMAESECADAFAAADEIERLRAALSTARADALEEAARAVDAKSDEWDTEWRRGRKVSSHLEGMSDGAHDCAAAIRALKEGK